MSLDKYISGDYFRNNPSWDAEDSPWKAKLVMEILDKNRISPTRFVEVGCGAGAVLIELSKWLPKSIFEGYDISPDAKVFWEKHHSHQVTYKLGDFVTLNKKKYDVLLMLDVVEHVSDPFHFLKALRASADYFVFHIPLDLNSISVFREKPLLHVREKVGHIHYFTKGLAEQLVEDCGYSIIDSYYTDACFVGRSRSFKTIFANIPRYILSKINKGVAARLLGGQTLILLAKK